MRNLRGVVMLALAGLWPLSGVALEETAVLRATPLLKTGSSWDGRQIVYPAGTAEVTGLLIELAPGGETGWHLHPVPSLAYILSGTLEVTQKNGQVKRLEAGEALAEVVDVWHNGRTIGSQPVKLVVFYLGATGQGLTVKQPAESAAK